MTTACAAAARRVEAALGGGHLALHFQPKVELASGAVPGVEALVRCEQPGLGVHGAPSVLAAAEAMRAIPDLTDWVVDAALAQRGAWAQAGHELTIAVNASPEALLSPCFADRVAEAIERHGARGPVLEIELTEGALLFGHDTIAQVLGRLRTLGVGLSIDDFGTGWSSLARLRRLPFDEIKIDRSFISGGGFDADDRAIVRTVVDLARHFERRVVAEGVEDADQLAWVAALGCDQAQGYHLARPLVADDLVAWLRRWRAAGGEAPAHHPGVAQPRGRAEQHLALRRLVAETAAAGIAGHEEDELLGRLADALGWPVAALWVFDEDVQLLRCAAYVARRALRTPDFERQTRNITYRPGSDLPGHVWETCEPRWLSDIPSGTRFPRAQAARRAGLHGAVAIPIRPEGRMLGVVELLSDAPEPPDAELLRELAELGLGRYGGALREASARRAAADRRRAEAALQRAQEVLDADVSHERAGRVLCEALETITGATSVMLWEPRGDRLDVVARAGAVREPLSVPLAGETSAVVAAYRSGRGAYVGRIEDSAVVSARLAALVPGSSALFEPLRAGDDVVATVSIVWRGAHERPDAGVRDLIKQLLSRAAPRLQAA